MGIVEILLIILIVLAFGGNLHTGGGWYGPGNFVGVILFVVLVFLLLRAAHVAL